MSKPVTAAVVREYLRKPEVFAGLSPEAQKNVNSHGRLHPENIKRFNTKRAKARRYVSGATTAAKQARTAARASLVEQGLAGKRGPLPKAVLASQK